MKRKMRYCLIVTATVLAVYGLSYLPLTLKGKYVVGKAKPHYCVYDPAARASDVGQWHPAGTRFLNDYAEDGFHRRTVGNFIGYVYSPLIRLDRKFFHKPYLRIEIIDPVGFE